MNVLIVSLIQILTTAVLVYAVYFMSRQPNEKYKITSIGLGIMAFAFLFKSIFNFYEIYSLTTWGLLEFIDLTGILILVWSIIKE